MEDIGGMRMGVFGHYKVVIIERLALLEWSEEPILDILERIVRVRMKIKR
jgi:hypothetical protein